MTALQRCSQAISMVISKSCFVSEKAISIVAFAIGYANLLDGVAKQKSPGNRQTLPHGHDLLGIVREYFQVIQKRFEDEGYANLQLDHNFLGIEIPRGSA